MDDPSPRGPWATLDLRKLRPDAVRVAVHPGPSLFALAADVAGARRGTPAALVAAARAELQPSDLAALAPIGVPRGRYVPGCLSTIAYDGPGDVASMVERIATLPVDRLLEDVAFASGPFSRTPWRELTNQPRRWLVRYACALARVWNAMRAPWRASGELLDREVERVRTAVARGALPALLAGLHHAAQVRDGRWRVPDHESRTLRPPGDGVRLTPVLAGPGAARVQYSDDGQLVAIVYPLLGPARVRADVSREQPAALEALIGAKRATILRFLDRPRHAGSVARAIGATPGSTTHHLRALEGAGLVIRERVGRQVIVRRTSRGSDLLDLYEDRG